MSSLDRALEIARSAHVDQVDKAGAPYLGHVLRVVAGVSDERAKIAAALHDVVEDCPDWTIARLREEGFEEDVLAAVDALTRRVGESYDDFIERLAGQPLALNVKIADLRDNADLSRLPHVTEADLDRRRKYVASLERLGARLVG